MELDEIGGYYCRHVSAMTGENLHSKSDIAAELGHRDMLIDKYKQALIDIDQATFGHPIYYPATEMRDCISKIIRAVGL